MKELIRNSSFLNQLAVVIVLSRYCDVAVLFFASFDLHKKLLKFGLKKTKCIMLLLAEAITGGGGGGGGGGGI